MVVGADQGSIKVKCTLVLKKKKGEDLEGAERGDKSGKTGAEVAY